MVAFDGVGLPDGVRPLPVYPYEKLSVADWSALKAAYVSLRLPGRVQPVRAVPGSPGRILAVGESPNFICDYALVTSSSSPGLAYAIKCVLENIPDERIVTDEKMLQRVFGPELKFVEEVVLGEA